MKSNLGRNACYEQPGKIPSANLGRYISYWEQGYHWPSTNHRKIWHHSQVTHRDSFVDLESIINRRTGVKRTPDLTGRKDYLAWETLRSLFYLSHFNVINEPTLFYEYGFVLFSGTVIDFVYMQPVKGQLFRAPPHLFLMPFIVYQTYHKKIKKMTYIRTSTFLCSYSINPP